MKERETTIIIVDRVKVETARAFLLVIDGKEYWFPKSQIENADGWSEGDQGDMEVTTWIASAKKLM